MTLSVVIAVYNSAEIFRRQCIHWAKLQLPSDIDFFIVDDGSDELLRDEIGVPNMHILRREPLLINGTRVWTVELSRNLGARTSSAEFLLMTDLDYIIPREAFSVHRTLKEDKARFKREFGVLLADGTFTQSPEELQRWGLPPERSRNPRMSPHPNNFIMRRDTFFALGAYREDLVDRPYPNKGDTYFKRTWVEALNRGEVTEQHADLRTKLYMFPNGQFCGDVDYNPFNLFHTLTRKTPNNHWYMVGRGNA